MKILDGVVAIGCALAFSATAWSQDGGLDASTVDGGGTSDGATDGGSAACATSGDCTRPTPYCHPVLHRCVTCLSDTNCIDSTGVCAEDRGVCVQCASDAHCFGTTPYCDAVEDECVQCLTNANCGSEGIQCIDGACGTCGDGFCGPGEVIVAYEDPYGYSYGPMDFVACPEDCLATCPSSDLGSEVGPAVASGSLVDGEDRLMSRCGGSGTPDASFGWSAPSAGTYVVDTFGSDADTLLYVIRGEDCSQPPLSCNDDTFELTSQIVFDATEGERFVIVVDSLNRVDGVSLNIHELSSYDGGGADCNPADCERLTSGEPPCCMPWGECGGQMEWGCDIMGREPPPFDPGGGGDGGPTDPVLRDRCLSNALSGGKAICAEVAQCTCEHCARATEDCRVIPGCLDLIQCMTQNGCSGLECNVPDACQGEIALSGGINGPGFRAATALQTCADGRGCSLVCPDVPDGGPTTPTCTPRREETCSCDDGSNGVRICKDDGSEFGACVCVDSEPDADAGTAPPSASTDDGGCGCRVPSDNQAEGQTWMFLAAIGVVGARYRRRRSGQVAS